MGKEEFRELLEHHDWFLASIDDAENWERTKKEQRLIEESIVNDRGLYEVYRAFMENKFNRMSI